MDVSPSEPTVRLGRLIRLAREAKGLSQRELGEILGTNQSTISGWESGTCPRIHNLLECCTALDVDPRAFLDAVEDDLEGPLKDLRAEAEAYMAARG